MRRLWPPHYAFDNWFDSIETAFAHACALHRDDLEERLDVALSRRVRAAEGAAFGTLRLRSSAADMAIASRALTGTFGKTEIAVPRARHG